MVESLNWTGDYFVKWIKKMATEDIQYVHPKQSVVDAFIKTIGEIHKSLVWTGSSAAGTSVAPSTAESRPFLAVAPTCFKGC